MILLLQHVLLLGVLYVTIVAGQVCSPPGQLVTFFFNSLELLVKQIRIYIFEIIL